MLRKSLSLFFVLTLILGAAQIPALAREARPAMTSPFRAEALVSVAAFWRMPWSHAGAAARRWRQGAAASVEWDSNRSLIVSAIAGLAFVAAGPKGLLFLIGMARRNEDTPPDVTGEAARLRDLQGFIRAAAILGEAVKATAADLAAQYKLPESLVRSLLAEFNVAEFARTHQRGHSRRFSLKEPAGQRMDLIRDPRFLGSANDDFLSFIVGARPEQVIPGFATRVPDIESETINEFSAVAKLLETATVPVTARELWAEANERGIVTGLLKAPARLERALQWLMRKQPVVVSAQGYWKVLDDESYREYRQTTKNTDNRTALARGRWLLQEFGINAALPKDDASRRVPKGAEISSTAEFLQLEPDILTRRLLPWRLFVLSRLHLAWVLAAMAPLGLFQGEKPALTLDRHSYQRPPILRAA